MVADPELNARLTRLFNAYVSPVVEGRTADANDGEDQGAIKLSFRQINAIIAIILSALLL